MNVRVHINVKIGRLVKFFVLSDLILLAGWGLVEPVFSIFIIERVRGATLVTIGVAVAIYWILRSVIQVPIANYLDRVRGEKDDFYALVLGLLAVSFSAIAFIFVREIWQLYAVQALRAAGFALYATSWLGIFSRHLDKSRASFEWALENTAVSVSAGVSGFLGGLFISLFGFPAVFIAVAACSFFAAVMLHIVPDIILSEPRYQKDAVKIDQSSLEKNL